ncbi:MAG TPA: two-component regulator propeller domain-containing protein [Flavipsychrobacter sp.]|nr:two-component regulator propeller domain-containing protein [Flavipsychrobacter sp.]
MNKGLLLAMFVLLNMKGWTQVNWTVYNTSNSGIASNTIYAIAVDVQGNKWFGTDAGVSKFNGTTWITYNTSNSGLANNSIFSIVMDVQGNIWFGGGGISKFDGANWTSYKTNNSGLVSNVVYSIAIDSLGNKWIGTYHGVSKFNDTTWTSYTINNSGLAHNSVQAIAIDGQGNKWFGTGGGGVSKFNGINWTTYSISNSQIAYNNIYSISIDALNNKWFGTQVGLSKYNDTIWTTYLPGNSGIASVNVFCLNTDASNHKWIGTYSGVNKFNGTTWTTYNISNSNLPDNWVNAIAIDALGNRWIGTDMGGVALLSGFPLPIRLLSFTGKSGKQKNLLQWKTANEKSHIGFHIERSVDGKTFETLRWMPAILEGSENNYSFTDIAPITGINYYRLKMTFSGGNIEFSNVLNLYTFGTSLDISIIPNPVYTQFHFITSSTGGTFQLLDLNCRVVFDQKIIEQNNKIDISTLAPGTYIYKYEHETGKLLKL